MISLSYTSMLLLIACGVLAILLVVWLIYRNMKDEDEYEKEMDDAGKQPTGNLENDRENLSKK